MTGSIVHVKVIPPNDDRRPHLIVVTDEDRIFIIDLSTTFATWKQLPALPD